MREVLPSEALALLREQHDQIRELADRCDEVLAGSPADAPISDELARAVSRLRIAVSAHNRDEEALLGPILLATDAFGPVRIGAMMRSHADEHQVLREGLYATSVAGIRPVIAQLREHLEQEETFFLSHRIVRDDVVALDGGADS